jgi:hypothetical protein
MDTDPDQREHMAAYRPDREEGDHQPIAIGNEARNTPLRSDCVLHKLLAQRGEAQSRDYPPGHRSRLAFALESGNQSREVGWHLSREHNPNGVAQLRQKHMASNGRSSLREVVNVARKPILGEPFHGLCV